VAFELQSCHVREKRATLETYEMSTSEYRAPAADAATLRDVLERVTRAWNGIDGNLAPSGGVARVLELYEQMRAGLARLDFEDLDRAAADVKAGVDALLTMDSDLRKLNNLKLLFEGRSAGPDERREGE
jgi:hypothetical protein